MEKIRSIPPFSGCIFIRNERRPINSVSFFWAAKYAYSPRVSATVLRTPESFKWDDIGWCCVRQTQKPFNEMMSCPLINVRPYQTGWHRNEIQHQHTSRIRLFCVGAPFWWASLPHTTAFVSSLANDNNYYNYCTQVLSVPFISSLYYALINFDINRNVAHLIWLRAS